MHLYTVHNFPSPRFYYTYTLDPESWKLVMKRYVQNQTIILSNSGFDAVLVKEQGQIVICLLLCKHLEGTCNTLVWCAQLHVVYVSRVTNSCMYVTQGVWDSGRSMSDLIHVVPLISFVVAITYSMPLSSIWERKRRAAISAYVTPPRKNTRVVRFSPCWPVTQQTGKNVRKA